MKSLLVLASALLMAVTGQVSFASAEVSQDQFNSMFNKYLTTDAGQSAVGDAVETHFKKKQEEQAKLQQEAAWKNRANIDVGSSPVKGAKNAKITIIKFSDFQCPYCQRGANNLEEVLKMYPNDVRASFKHLPLPFHKEARPAAKASIAAGKQNKFWEMYKVLFDNQGKLGASFYEEQAKALGLNVDQFKKDMASEETEKAVAADEAVAKQNGVQGTPAFFINGIRLEGAQPPAEFKKIIDRLLTEKA